MSAQSNDNIMVVPESILTEFSVKDSNWMHHQDFHLRKDDIIYIEEGIYVMKNVLSSLSSNSKGIFLYHEFAIPMDLSDESVKLCNTLVNKIVDMYCHVSMGDKFILGYYMEEDKFLNMFEQLSNMHHFMNLLIWNANNGRLEHINLPYKKNFYTSYRSIINALEK